MNDRLAPEQETDWGLAEFLAMKLAAIERNAARIRALGEAGERVRQLPKVKAHLKEAILFEVALNEAYNELSFQIEQAVDTICREGEKAANV